MFMNLDTLPAGKAMFTLGVTGQPTGTPADQLAYDEVDVVTSARATTAEVVHAARFMLDRDYAGCRVIGCINQSQGYVMVETPDGDLR